MDDTGQIQRDTTQELPKTTAIKHTRRIVFGSLGVLLIVAGLALIPVPGPFTIPLLLAGLTVLSWEFRWAKRLLFETRLRFKRLKAKRATRL